MKIVICIVSILLLTSCSIHGNFEGLYSYYNITKSRIPDVLIQPDSTFQICSLVNTKQPRVYLANGSRLKECVSNHDAVVYIWKPKCASNLCYSLNALQDKCKTIHKDLFIVAECYDADMMSLTYNIDRPILGIDTRYYRSERTARYLSRFLFDLTSHYAVNGRVLYFKNGVFTQSCHSVDSLRL